MSKAAEAPRVSLAMPVYNGEAYVAQAVRSILDQTYENFELIVNDNASTDATGAICLAFAEKDARVRYMRNPVNLGAAPNHNIGFAAARGEFFKWCASDDYLAPDFIGKCVRALDENPGAALAYGETKSVDENGDVMPLVGSLGPVVTGQPPAERFYNVMRYVGTCYEIFGLYRRATLARSTLQRSYYGSDHALLAEIALLGDYVFVPDTVFYNREHKDRSINMTDIQARVLWQDTSKNAKHSMQHLKHLAHLMEIAWRHRGEVDPAVSLFAVARSELRPIQLMRYGLDAAGLASPALRSWLRERGWSLVNKAQMRLT
ncbi:glycosyltransferase family 2 protein [Methylocella sp.]|uniref:glycosyltransferase family 2 protein n=1 Tax=Methylocella sp. TaxID=1978226 RepID=UPI003784D9C9